ncbi:MAG: AAA family ATPase [Bacillota bacterium]
MAAQMIDSPTLLIAGDTTCERAAEARWPKARVVGAFRDLALVEYVLSGMKVDIVAVGPGMKGRGESLESWISRCKAAFPHVSVVLVDAADIAGVFGGSGVSDSSAGPGNVIAPCTVVVWSPKGGVGKTFLATNLACAAAIATGGMAGLLDLDLYSGDASVHLDLLDGPTLTEILPVLQELRPEGLDRFSQRHAPSGLSVVSSPRRPELSELVTTEHVKSVLSLAAKRWALVYIDTPPDITSAVVGECIDAASRIVLVVTQDVATLKQCKLALDIFARLGIPSESLAVVLNRVSKDSLLPLAKVQEFLGVEVLGSVPEDRKAVERSVFEGKPVVLYGKSEIGEAVWQIVDRITPGLHPPKTKKPARFRRDFPW